MFEDPFPTNRHRNKYQAAKKINVCAIELLLEFIPCKLETTCTKFHLCMQHMGRMMSGSFVVASFFECKTLSMIRLLSIVIVAVLAVEHFHRVAAFEKIGHVAKQEKHTSLIETWYTTSPTPIGKQDPGLSAKRTTSPVAQALDLTIATLEVITLSPSRKATVKDFLKLGRATRGSSKPTCGRHFFT